MTLFKTGSKVLIYSNIQRVSDKYEENVLISIKFQSKHTLLVCLIVRSFGVCRTSIEIEIYRTKY